MTITFTDITATIVTYLNGILSPPVLNRPNNPRDTAFVVVRRVGGVRNTMVSDEAMLTVEAWAPSPAAAHDLCQAARAHIYEMRGTTVGGVQVYRVQEIAGPAQLPDPVSEQPRYTLTVQVGYRGTVV